MNFEVLLELLVQLPAYALLIGAPLFIAYKIKNRRDKKKKEQADKKEPSK